MHFRADLIDGELRITDLESQNGTYVDGKKITKTTVAKTGSIIKTGKSVIRVRASSRGYLTGTDLAGYRLERRLGGGGMGEVYKATQVSLGRIVAVKVLSDKFASDRSFVKRFIAEARAAGKLSHTNVVQVYDVGDEEGRYFISMEYVENGSVEDLLGVEGTLDGPRARKVALETARALEYAERQGIVHCDVKPDNLLLTMEGDVRLADLGVAKRVGEPAAGDDEGVFGSPHYMSPEQARGDQLDHRSDLYSLGATLFKMLSGRTLFTGDNSRKVMEAHVFEKPESLRDVNPNVPRALADIVDRLVEKDPDDRYQSASDLISALERPEISSVRAGKPKAKSARSAKSSKSSKSSKPLPDMSGRQARPRASGSSAMATFIKVAVALTGLAVFGGFLVGHLGRGRRAFERAQKFEEAGRFSRATKAYQDVVRIESASSTLAMRARSRIEAIMAVADEERERTRCLEGVKSAEADAAAGGGELVRAIERIQTISRSSDAGFEIASEPLARLRKRLDELAASELKAIREEAAALIDKNRYTDAARLFSEFPSYYRSLPVTEGVDAEGPRIMEQARTDWAAARSQVRRLMANLGRDNRAMAESQSILIPFVNRTGIAAIQDEARALRKQVEARAQDVSRNAADSATKARMAEAETIVAQALLLEHGYHFDHARKLLRRAEGMFRNQGKRARADELGRRIAAIQRPEILFDLLLGRAAEMKLGKHTIAVAGGPKGRVVGARKESEEFFVRTESGAGTRVKWDRLPPAEIVKLFRAMKPTPDDRLVIAAFALDHGLVSHAKKELLFANRVRAENVPLARILKFRVKIGAPALPDEVDAKTLADLALSVAEKGDTKKALEFLELLQTRYAETEAARTRVEEIGEAIAAGSAKSNP
jgi:serine/threonine protein kinase